MAGSAAAVSGGGPPGLESLPRRPGPSLAPVPSRLPLLGLTPRGVWLCFGLRS